MVEKQKTPLKDMVIILPGITGTVLQKNGKDVWGASVQAISRIILSGGENLQELKLQGSDSGGVEYGDGIKAARLVADAQIIPGLVKILDGYSQTSQLITDNFEVVNTRIKDQSKIVPGDIYHDPETVASNFYHFPYDWRRDNRINGRILNQLVNKRLKIWREYSGNPDAKVILLAHSMGGLISRYHLEVLGGWQDCRALFTFGTPYRGSVNAVNFIANGLKKGFVDLTSVMRSLPSVYQLLPIYAMLQVGTENKRIAETPELPHFNQIMTQDALAFHREIESAVITNSKDSRYHEQFATVPFVGVKQPTLQSAEFKDGIITASRQLPRIMQGHKLDHLADGDGTVPQISAFPLEFSDQEVLETVSFIADKHGALQNHKTILLSLLNKMQIAETLSGIDTIRGIRTENTRSAALVKGISLDLEDLYSLGDEIEIAAQVSPADSRIRDLNAIIECLSEPQTPLNLSLEPSGSRYLIKPANLSSGLYRITVQASDTIENSPTAVHDLFAIA